MEQIHYGHQGIEKCMLKARESVFWPGISDDIWEAVERCGICQSTSRAVKPVGNVSEVPPQTWHTLGTDLFYWNKMDYLVVGDHFSKYLASEENSKYFHTFGDKGARNDLHRVWMSICTEK